VGSELAGLLNRLRRQGVAPDYLGQILSAFETDYQLSATDRSGQLSTADDPVDPLTNREVDVLDLLAQRFSNKEIAAQLLISPLTVKKHTNNIYQKLQVTNRRQAVRKAAALGLVAEP
jgi:LuxR family maltose regulon positive regulatory protein